MRSIAWVLAAIMIVVTAAVVYVLLQPNRVVTQSIVEKVKAEIPKTPASMPVIPTTGPAPGELGPGEGVWVEIPDEKTGRLAWQFRASHYDPLPDNSVNCQRPQAQFFLADGQIVTIEGTHGHVVMSGNALNSNGPMRGGGTVPSRGQLYDVTVTLSNAINPRHAILRARTNNASFDNDTFRINTESFKSADGSIVAADEVPVQVRGDDYDFDGRGLIIRWNDLDRKLQYLEVTHGQELVVKNAQLLPQQEGATGGARPATRGAAATSPTTKPAKAAPAKPAAKPGAKGGRKPEPPTTTPASKPATKPTSQPVYHAVFNGGASGVRVTQGGKPISFSEILTADFMSKEEDNDEPAPAAGPAKKPATTTAPVVRRPVTRPTSTAAPAPTSAPAPLIIRWPDKLVVTPVETDIPKLNPGEMNLHLLSTKKTTHLNYNGWDVVCATCTYLAGGKGAELHNSATVPLVIVKGATGAEIYTPNLVYNQLAGRAVLTGKSHTIMPVQSDTDGSTETIKASWSDLCVLSLVGQSQSDMQLRHADITGDVHVDHPKLKMDSATLQLAFAPTTNSSESKSPPVERIDADGSVKTTMLDEQGQPRHVDSDHLTVAMAPTPTGQWRPRTVTANGNVHTYDDQQKLDANLLIATLSPTTQEGDTPHLERVIAQQNVKFSAGDSSGSADQMTADADGEDYDVRLIGQPSASVKSKDAKISGATINLKPKRQTLEVVGAGTLDGTQQQNASDNPTPFNMTWAQGLQYDGTANKAHASDHIVFNSVSADGTRNTAVGDALDLVLMDDPNATTQPTTAATEPASRPASQPAASRPSTQGSDALASGFGGMQKKVVKLMTLSGGSEIDSILNNADGSLLKRTNLFAPLVQIQPADQHVVVPVPGRMLFEDTRGATTRPTSGPATQPAKPAGGMNGTTAFSWQKELNFDQAADEAQLIGGVVIVHQGSAATDAFRLVAEHVTVDFDKPDKSATKPANAGPTGSAKVKSMVAEQSVHFSSKQIQFDAERISYDPATNTMIASGAGRVPVLMYDDKGTTTGSFSEVEFDTVTQQIRRMRDVRGTISR